VAGTDAEAFRRTTPAQIRSDLVAQRALMAAGRSLK